MGRQETACTLSRKPPKNHIRTWAAALGLFCSWPHTGALAEKIEVTARPIENFRIGATDTVFGALTFIGGLELNSNAEHFGALSAIDVNAQTGVFHAIADTGFHLTGKLVRDETGRITQLKNVQLAELTNSDGSAILDKWQADGEGIALDGDEVLISFERDHRIARYIYDAQTNALTLKSQIPPPVPLYELRGNRGFEGIAIAPKTASFPGALIGIAEKSLDKNGNMMGFVAPVGAAPFEFSLMRDDNFDVTDIGFLPDGDLLVLERRFVVTSGVAMRIRRVDGTTIAPGATVNGELLLFADMSYQIDNMEGLSVFQMPDGATRLILVSDDNQSLLQRNLFLEFELTR